jgi:hypothetical protein
MIVGDFYRLQLLGRVLGCDFDMIATLEPSRRVLAQVSSCSHLMCFLMLSSHVYDQTHRLQQPASPG